MSEGIKLSIELAHSDGLGIEHVRMHSLEWYPSWCSRPLQSCQSVSQHFVALCLPRDGRPNQHQAVTNHRGLVELYALVYEALDIFQAFLQCTLANASF